jgi:hypothetical protein
MNELGQANGTGASGGYVRDYATRSAGAIEQVRPPEIPRYSAELEKNLHACAEALTDLENKLSNVAYSDPPSPANTANQITAAPQTGMGRQMQEMSAHAASIHQRIQSLIRRLEV